MRHLAGHLDVVGLTRAQILALVLDGMRESVRHYKPTSPQAGRQAPIISMWKANMHRSHTLRERKDAIRAVVLGGATIEERGVVCLRNG